MGKFTIVPRGHVYWIEAIAEDGSRTPVERYETEDAAVRRLHALQPTTEAASKRNAALEPGPARKA
jgi:hypothetical protein